MEPIFGLGITPPDKWGTYNAFKYDGMTADEYADMQIMAGSSKKKGE